MRRNCYRDQKKKLLKIETEGREYFKFFEITITIHLRSENSIFETEGSKQNAFLNCSWRFLRSNAVEQFKFKEKLKIDFLPKQTESAIFHSMEEAVKLD